jgi:hydroxymethylglutaryl-CoA lyase
VHPIDVCGIPVSASEAHNQANLRRTKADHRNAVAEMVNVLLAEGITPLIGVVTAFGCPLQGEVPREDVYDVVDWAYELGVRSIMFGDTTGLATPTLVRETLDVARRQWPDVFYVGHFHDNRGVGVANSLAAFEAGADMLDGSLGGIGGEPPVVDQGFVGEAGNTATEDLVSMLAAMGHLPHVDVEAVLRAGALAQAVTGRPLYSRVQLARREAVAAR